MFVFACLISQRIAPHPEPRRSGDNRRFPGVSVKSVPTHGIHNFGAKICKPRGGKLYWMIQSQICLRISYFELGMKWKWEATYSISKVNHGSSPQLQTPFVSDIYKSKDKIPGHLYGTFISRLATKKAECEKMSFASSRFHQKRYRST
jgi:hypothetical protein